MLLYRIIQVSIICISNNKREERERMSFYYYFNKICYIIGNDRKIPIIEEVMSCSVVGGKYYPRFTSYLIKDNLDTNKLNQLSNVLKCHCEVKHEDYRYILKCYYRYELPSFIPFCYKPTDRICVGESYDGRFTIGFGQYTNIIIGRNNWKWEVESDSIHTFKS